MDRDAQLAGLAELESTGTRFLPLRRRRKLELAPWARLARFLSRERVDVLHAHKFGSNVFGVLAGSAARVPVLLAHEHTWSYEGQPLRRFLDRELIARRADRFIAVSREDQRRMIDVERIAPERTIFIPNGIPDRILGGPSHELVAMTATALFWRRAAGRVDADEFLDASELNGNLDLARSLAESLRVML